MGTGGYYARRFSPVGQGFMIEGSYWQRVNENNYRVFVKKVLQIYPNLKKNSNGKHEEKFFYGSNSCS
jgi:hypothetical protein